MFGDGLFKNHRNRCLLCGKKIPRTRDFCSKICERWFYGEDSGTTPG